MNMNEGFNQPAVKVEVTSQDEKINDEIGQLDFINPAAEFVQILQEFSPVELEEFTRQLSIEGGSLHLFNVVEEEQEKIVAELLSKWQNNEEDQKTLINKLVDILSA